MRAETKLEMDMVRTLEQLPQSPYHQEIGRKMCAAFMAAFANSGGWTRGLGRAPGVILRDFPLLGQPLFPN